MAYKNEISERATKWGRENREALRRNQKRYRNKAKPCCYIWKHNEFFYIGATKQHAHLRFRDHKSKNNTQLGHYIREHGLARKDFELQTFFFETIEEARKHEKELICKHIDEEKCLNTQRW